MYKICLPNNITETDWYNICSYKNKEEMKKNKIWVVQAILCEINSKILEAMADNKTSIEYCIPKFLIESEEIKFKEAYEYLNYKVEMKDQSTDDPNLVDVTWVKISWEPLKEVDEDMN